jgi:putative ABC transport system substrate-binding protein
MGRIEMANGRNVIRVTIAVVLLFAPSFAELQPARRVPQVALLLTGSPSDTDRRTAAFQQGLHDLGYVEGQTVAVIPRWADVPQRLSELASDVVRNNVDVIVTEGTPAAQAAKRATGTIPIVMATSGDPVAVGLVASLAQPGGNVTGQSILSPDLNGKRLELIKDLVPSISRVAVLSNPANPIHAVDIKAAEAAAKVLGISVHVLEVRGPDGFERAFQVATELRVGALLALVDPFITANRTRVAKLAVRSRLPAVYGLSGFAEAGGLASFGPDLGEMFRRAAVFVDKILKGAKPADLPVEQPTRFELVINATTAKTLGLRIPQSVLLRADRVIN